MIVIDVWMVKIEPYSQKSFWNDVPFIFQKKNP
jgi:hypothetical protein